LGVLSPETAGVSWAAGVSKAAAVWVYARLNANPNQDHMFRSVLPVSRRPNLQL